LVVHQINLYRFHPSLTAIQKEIVGNKNNLSKAFRRCFFLTDLRLWLLCKRRWSCSK